MTPPAASSKRLTTASVRDILAARFPHLRPGRVVELLQTEDCHTFEVDGEWIVRFHIRADGEERMLREAALLEAIAPRLPLAVPAFELLGQPDERCPYPFNGYRKIAGVSGEELRPPDEARPAVAAQLGAFLSALHAVPLAEGLRVGLTPQPMEEPEPLLAATRRYAATVQRELPGFVDELMRRYLSGSVSLPPPSPSDLFVCHADIKGEHVIVSDAADAVIGVIDWTDACLTDRLLDFTGLMIWLGEPFVRQVLDSYTVAIDEHFMARVAFYARCFALGNLGERLHGESNAPLELLKTQARWAFTT